MPRKNRIETSDGLYHVINRGNYRSWVFETDGAKKSFEKTLYEACERAGTERFGYRRKNGYLGMSEFLLLL